MVAGRFRIVVLADGELSVVSAAQFSYVVHIVTASAVDVDKSLGQLTDHGVMVVRQDDALGLLSATDEAGHPFGHDGRQGGKGFVQDDKGRDRV